MDLSLLENRDLSALPEEVRTETETKTEIPRISLGPLYYQDQGTEKSIE